MIKKFFSSLKSEGVFKTIKKVGRYVKFKFFTRKNNNLIEDIVDTQKFKTVIIFENNFGWNRIMKQRPQQIAENLPEDTLMFYHSHDNEDYVGAKKRIKKLKDNLVLIDLGYHRDKLLGNLSFHTNKYLMIYSTDYIPEDRVEMYKGYNYKIIYEYVDDVNETLSGEVYPQLVKRHNNILNSDANIVCTATELYNKAIKKSKKENPDNILLVSNGVDYDHFKPGDYEIPDDLKEIREKYKYLICYYGALASWFDYKLVKELAKNKDYAIVLLGLKYDETYDESGIEDIENIFYLGKKNYDELPYYSSHMDVLTIPFLINDITKATSPVKIFEYMAMEKPIVTTALPECKKYKSVLFSESKEEFIDNIKKAIKLVDDKKNCELLKKEALENTWQSKANDIVQFINDNKTQSLKARLKKVLKTEKYDRIILWRSPFGWNVPLFQRPQHIARKFAKQNCLVFYEVTLQTDLVEDFKKQEDLYLVNYGNSTFEKLLYEVLREVDVPKYVQIYSTNWSMSLDELKGYEEDGYKVLYEYIDDISPELAGTEELPEYVVQKYDYAMSNENVLVVTTAKKLYDDVKSKRGEKNLVFSCNGVDYDFYQKIEKKFKYEKEFTSLINNGKINLCYYGALAKWFDYELIREIDKTDKYNIILIGVKYDESYDESGIEELSNVHFLGSKDYAILKNYACKMDILTIPFLINDITRATSPLKLFEYMALHKPIVTTPMDECKKYKSVLIGENHDEFIKQLEKAYNLRSDKKYIELLDKEARENDWGSKASVIVDQMKKNENHK